MPRLVINSAKLKLIEESYLKMSSNDIGTKIGVSGSTVRRYMRKHGWSVSRQLSNEFRRNKNTGRTNFSPKVDEYIQDNYLEEPINTMARNLGISGTGVRTRMNALGLNVPKSLAKQMEP